MRVMSTGQEAVAYFCGWEGNRTFGVAPAMCHRFPGISTYGLQCLRKGDETPAYTPLRSMAPFSLALPMLWVVRLPVCLV